VRGFGDSMQQATVAGHAGPIASLSLAWFEERLGVVEHQQTASITQQPQQGPEPFRPGRRWHHLLVGQEADGARQPVAPRWGVAQATPVDAVEGIQAPAVTFLRHTNASEVTPRRWAVVKKGAKLAMTS
jgi:hypothetical protein